MYHELNEYLERTGKTPVQLGQMIGRPHQSIYNWLKKGGYKVDYDGRTFRVNWVTRPGKIVYIRKTADVVHPEVRDD